MFISSNASKPIGFQYKASFFDHWDLPNIFKHKKKKKEKKINNKPCNLDNDDLISKLLFPGKLNTVLRKMAHGIFIINTVNDYTQPHSEVSLAKNPIISEVG